MSDNESSCDGNESDVNNSNDIFHDMIMDAIEEIKVESGQELVISSNADNDENEEYIKNIYKSVAEKCRELYRNMMDANSNVLWNSIIEKADSFKEANEHLDLDHDTVLNVGLKKYKCVLMQEIRSILSEEIDEEVSDSDTDLEETNKSDDASRAGSGVYKNFINKRQ